MIPCPNCGAQIQFRSPASVMAVCEYCKTTVLKELDAVKNLGKMSDVLEDYSPLQLNTSGIYGTHSFTIIGRLQLRYADGMWNEWYVMFENGKTAWLSDASGQYTMTTEVPASNDLPPFSALVPSQHYTLIGKSYTAADVRIADCIGGQGELPFKIGSGWQARVADFRAGQTFITLDYSESETPKVFAGKAVTLEELKCQLLRDDERIKAAAENIKGKVMPMTCPHCGSSTSFLPGLTSTLICPSCHSQLDTSGSIAQVLAIGKKIEQVYTTLSLGAQANIAGKAYEIIGILRRSDNENTEWTEYLLYSPKAGFLWIIETDDGWARATVLDEWPTWETEDVAVLNNTSFQKLYRYPARVSYAIGAFNWRVAIGYQTNNVEFQYGTFKLAAEITDTEMTWSHSTPISADQIHAWFGDTVKAQKTATADTAKSTAIKFIWLVFLLNIIPIFLAPIVIIPVLIGAAALYFPALFLDSQKNE